MGMLEAKEEDLTGGTVENLVETSMQMEIGFWTSSESVIWLWSTRSSQRVMPRHTPSRADRTRQ